MTAKKEEDLLTLLLIAVVQMLSFAAGLSMAPTWASNASTETSLFTTSFKTTTESITFESSVAETTVLPDDSTESISTSENIPASVSDMPTTSLDPCSRIICFNGGTCRADVEMCECPNWFVGMFCETAVQDELQITEPLQITYTEGDVLNTTCSYTITLNGSSSSSPYLVNVTWKINDTVLANSSRVTIKTDIDWNSTLIITELEWRDSGELTCGFTLKNVAPLYQTIGYNSTTQNLVVTRLPQMSLLPRSGITSTAHRSTTTSQIESTSASSTTESTTTTSETTTKPTTTESTLSTTTTAVSTTTSKFDSTSTSPAIDSTTTTSETTTEPTTTQSPLSTTTAPPSTTTSQFALTSSTSATDSISTTTERTTEPTTTESTVSTSTARPSTTTSQTESTSASSTPDSTTTTSEMTTKPTTTESTLSTTTVAVSSTTSLLDSTSAASARESTTRILEKTTEPFMISIIPWSVSEFELPSTRASTDRDTTTTNTLTSRDFDSSVSYEITEMDLTTEILKETTDLSLMQSSLVTSWPMTNSSHAPTTSTPVSPQPTTSLDPCDVIICFNGGTCLADLEMCECPQWFAGKFCETAVQDDLHIPVTLEKGYIEGDPLNTTCSYTITLNGSSSSSPYLVDVTWKINDTVLANSNRVTIKTDIGWNSTLIITGSECRDSGVLTCGFTLKNEAPLYQTIGYNSTTQNLVVTRLPQMSLLPRSGITVIGNNLSFTCLHQAGERPDYIEWFNDGNLLFNDTNTTESNYTISSNKSTELQLRCRGCLINSKCGAENSSFVKFVENVDKQCNGATDKYNISWPSCPEGEVLIGPCPKGFIGESTRKCGENGVWEETNIINCVEEDVSEAIEDIDYIIGIGANDTDYIEEVLNDLEDAIKPNDKPVPPGNINSTVTALADLAEARSEVEDAHVSKNETQAVVSIMSDLLTETNNDSWQDILTEDTSVPQTIINTVDTYAEMRCQALEKGENESLYDDNLLLSMDNVDPDKIHDVVFPIDTNHQRSQDFSDRLSYQSWLKDEVKISQELLTNTLDYFEQHNKTSSELTVSSTFYRTIHSLMSSNVSSDDLSTSESELGSLVMSVVMPSDLPDDYTLTPPIEMNINIVSVANENWTISPNCVYYDVNFKWWSTDGMKTIQSENETNVTCLANHTTNFGVIIRPDVPLSDLHDTILTWLTHTLLSVSIVCMITTIIVYGAYWKKLRSHHGVLLINLCVSLICGHVVFMVEAWRNEDEPWIKETEEDLTCIVMGALMHFFYLSAFCVMLAEGVQILISVTCIFRPKRFKETYGLTFGAWLTSAIIVLLTAGMTQGDAYGVAENGGSCWLKLNDDYSGSIWAFAGPVIVIILVNLIISIFVLYKSVKMSKMTKSQHELVRSALWNLMVLCPILGISWVFGIFALTDASEKVTIAFLYLFTIFSTLQGFFLFLFHCILNKKAYELISTCGKPSVETSDRREAYQTATTSRGLEGKGSHDEPTTSKDTSLSEEVMDINRGFVPDSPVTVHRERLYDELMSSLYAPDTAEPGSSGEDQTRMRTSQCSVPGYSFQKPLTGNLPDIDWERFLDNLDDGVDNRAFHDDSNNTYF